MTTTPPPGAEHGANDDLTFTRGRYRLIAAALIVCALLGAVGCVVADVL